MSGTVLVNCTVVDAERDAPLRDAGVWTRGDAIAAVGPADVAAAPPGPTASRRSSTSTARTSCRASSTCTPTCTTRRATPVARRRWRWPTAWRATRAPAWTPASRPSASSRSRSAPTSRSGGRSAAGRTAGPRIHTAGRALVCTGGHGHEGNERSNATAPGVPPGRPQPVKAGADLIKVMISGGIAGEHEGIHTPQLFADELTRGDRDRARLGSQGGRARRAGRRDRRGGGAGAGLHGARLPAHRRRSIRRMAERGAALVPTLLVTRCKEFFDELARRSG